MKRILVLLTGGTISAKTDENGVRDADAKTTKSVLEAYARKNGAVSDCTEFEYLNVFGDSGILSENMTLSRLNTMTEIFRTVDYDKFDGLIVLHGTDTLAYSAAYTSLVLSNTSRVFFVSSNAPLNDENANGYANFIASVKLIERGIKKNVYVVYRNLSDDTLYLHLGSKLLQCDNDQADFFSDGMEEINDGTSGIEASGDPKLFDINKSGLTRRVLLIQPYVGMCYDCYSLDQFGAVLHGSFHSGTACADSENESDSVLSLINRCVTKNIPFYFFPVDTPEYASSALILKQNGVIPLGYLTPAMAYSKVLIDINSGKLL